jgi:hypothetical protein
MNKRLGEYTCNNFKNCEGCPLVRLNCLEWIGAETLEERLERWYEEFDDIEVYEIIKKRLEVKQ